jgi:NTE family protein
MRTMKKVGIALGGGGAKGLAHISMLEVLDDLGVRPHRISGTSVGAIMGAVYASGLTAGEMRKGVAELLATPRTLKEWIDAKQLPGWIDFIDIDVGRGSLLQVDGFLEELEKVIGVSRFEDLAIPLQVVAADFWAREEVIIESGPIIPAVAASFALPGIFKPVVMDGRVLVDGGSVNPLPYDLLLGDCDIVIAVDVSGTRRPTDDLLPSYSETIFNTFQIAEETILNQKMKTRPPSIFIRPEIEDVKVLEVHKSNQIIEQSKAARYFLRRELEALLAH